MVTITFKEIDELKGRHQLEYVYCPACGFKTNFESPEGLTIDGLIIKCFNCHKTLAWKKERGVQ